MFDEAMFSAVGRDWSKVSWCALAASDVSLSVAVEGR